MQVGERCAIGHLRLQLRAELRLPAGALEEQHELPRHLPRHLRPVVLLDQGKRQIHARSHSRRGVDPILTHEDGIDIDAHLRIALGQAQAAAPVGGGALAVEEAGLCKDECPGADGGEPADALGDALQPADEAVVLERRLDAAPASDEERVDSAPDLPEAAIHDEPDPR